MPTWNISSLYCTKLYEKYSKIWIFFVISDREKLKEYEISIKYSFFFHSISIGLIVVLPAIFAGFGTKIPKFGLWAADPPNILNLFKNLHFSIFHSLIRFPGALNFCRDIALCPEKCCFHPLWWG